MSKNDQVYSEPSEVDADDGTVHVQGPDLVDVRLTAEAASETSDRLREGSANALGQRYFAKRKLAPRTNPFVAEGRAMPLEFLSSVDGGHTWQHT